MQTRRLGRTQHMSTLAILGTAAFYVIDQEGATAALDLALARGVNHIDLAPGYGLAEERTGPWLESRRDKFFVGCKTQQRDRETAWSELRRSLERLRIKSFDLYQLHAVTTFEELDQVFAKGGAMETLLEAREKGFTRFLGITGHGVLAPSIYLKALERFDFDTVMFPLNPVLYANPDYRRDAERLLQECQARDVGVMIIKSIARGPWGDLTKSYNTWYQPFDDAATIRDWVHFALSQPVTAIATAADVGILPMVLDAAESFAPMEAAVQAKVMQAAAELTPLFT